MQILPSYKEVDKKKGKETMIKEYQFKKNDVYDAVSRPEGKSVVSSMWIYKIKYVEDGNIKGYKARFMVSLRKREYTMECNTPLTRHTSPVK